MRPRDYLLVAVGNVIRQKLRSALTVAAIVIGATGITVMLTFVTSIKHYALAQFVQAGEERQIVVAPNLDLSYSQFGDRTRGGPASIDSAGVVLTTALVRRIERIPHVAALTPMLSSFGYRAFEWLEFGGKRFRLSGVEAYEPNGVIHPAVVAGRALAASDKTGAVMLSKSYADALGFKGRYERLVGRTVSFHTHAGYAGAGAPLPALRVNTCGPGARWPCGGPLNVPPMNIPARIVGVNANGNEGPMIFFPLAWALKLNAQAHVEGDHWVRPSITQAIDQRNPDGSGNGYDSVILDVDSTANVDAVALQIRRLRLGAATAQEEIAKQVHAFNVVSFVLGGLGLVALFIAALGVINTMVMAVFERTREIGVMRAVGAKRSTIRRLFTVEASTLGFLGGAIGVLIGYVAVLVANPIINRQLRVEKITSSNILSVPIWLVFAVVVGTTLIGMLSGLMPARRAARLDPVEALRYE